MQHTDNSSPATNISVPAPECLLQNKKARIWKRTGWKTGPSKEKDSTSEAVCVQCSLHASSLPFCKCLHRLSRSQLIQLLSQRKAELNRIGDKKAPPSVMSHFHFQFRIKSAVSEQYKQGEPWNSRN